MSETPPKTTKIIEVEADEKITQHARVWEKVFIGLLILLGIAALLAVYYFLTNRQAPENVNLNTNVTNIQPPPSGAVEGIITPPSILPPSSTTPLPLPAQLPTPGGAPTTLPQPLRTYQNSKLGFNVKIPNDWMVIKEISDEVIFTLPDKSRYSVQMYFVPNTNLENIRSGLLGLSNIHNVSDATFAGQNGLKFNVDGIYQQGIAFLHNSRLYYILGPNIQTSSLTGIQTK